jgi:hypothetical protein
MTVRFSLETVREFLYQKTLFFSFLACVYDILKKDKILP